MSRDDPAMRLSEVTSSTNQPTPWLADHSPGLPAWSSSHLFPFLLAAAIVKNKVCANATIPPLLTNGLLAVPISHVLCGNESKTSGRSTAAIVCYTPPTSSILFLTLLKQALQAECERGWKDTFTSILSPGSICLVWFFKKNKPKARKSLNRTWTIRRWWGDNNRSRWGGVHAKKKKIKGGTET